MSTPASPSAPNPITTATQSHTQAVSDLLVIANALRDASFSQARHAEVGAAYNRISTLIQGQTVSGLIAAATVPDNDRTARITPASQVTGLPAALQGSAPSAASAAKPA